MAVKTKQIRSYKKKTQASTIKEEIAATNNEQKPVPIASIITIPQEQIGKPKNPRRKRTNTSKQQHPDTKKQKVLPSDGSPDDPPGKQKKKRVTRKSSENETTLSIKCEPSSSNLDMLPSSSDPPKAKAFDDRYIQKVAIETAPNERSTAKWSDDYESDYDNKPVRDCCIQLDNGKYSCKLCNKSYTHISNFTRHFESSHRSMVTIYRCLVCEKNFKRKDNLATHFKAIHKYSPGEVKDLLIEKKPKKEQTIQVEEKVPKKRGRKPKLKEPVVELLES